MLKPVYKSDVTYLSSSIFPKSIIDDYRQIFHLDNKLKKSLAIAKLWINLENYVTFLSTTNKWPLNHVFVLTILFFDPRRPGLGWNSFK